MKSSRAPDSRSLETRLRQGLSREVDRSVKLSTTPLFLDLAWDSDLTGDDLKALEPAVVVDAVHSSKQLVFQIIRGELRYWLTTDRSPAALASTAETQLGVAPSLDYAIALCREFIVGELSPHDV